MSKKYFDYDSGEIGFIMDDKTAMSSDGHFMMRLDDNAVMDMDSGEVHFISGWSSDDDDD